MSNTPKNRTKAPKQLIISLPIEKYEQLAMAELMLKSYQAGKTITLPDRVDDETFNSLVMYLNRELKLRAEQPLMEVPKELEVVKDTE